MSFWGVAFNRIPAILTTLILELFVGIVISRYHMLIRQNILISSFLPILSSIAGNVGLQASTSTLRAISTGYAQMHGLRGILLKELQSSMVMAALASILILAISAAWAGSFAFGLATALALIINITGAGILGASGIKITNVRTYNFQIPQA